MGEFDSGAAWLMQHFGRSLLGLAGVSVSGKITALANKLVLPTRIPDGLLQAEGKGPRAEPEFYLLEVATRGETRLPEQMHDDLALSRLAMRRVPNAVAFVLRPHSATGLAPIHRAKSSLGWSYTEAGWKVIRCYELKAAELLARGEAGLAPFVLVAQATEPGLQLAAQVRRMVEDQLADAEEQANLLAVCQVFSELRYNDPQVFEFLGGRKMVLQSSWMRKVWAEETARATAERVAAAKAAGLAEGLAEGMAEGMAAGRAQGEAQAKAEFLVRVLRRRFAEMTPELEARVGSITQVALLDGLLERALTCRSLRTFVRALPR